MGEIMLVYVLKLCAQVGHKSGDSQCPACVEDGTILAFKDNICGDVPYSSWWNNKTNRYKNIEVFIGEVWSHPKECY